MRKKFLSAFLLGALAIATTSTMVSCKDYDDDIKSLKDQLKTLEGVVDQKEQAIKTSISDLQTQINKANEDHATKALRQLRQHCRLLSTLTTRLSLRRTQS